MKITIVGAGNIGTQFAVHCAYKGHQVIMFGSKPHLVQNRLSIVEKDGKELFSGEIYKSTSEPKEAFEDAELIFVTVPAFIIK